MTRYFQLFTIAAALFSVAVTNLPEPAQAHETKKMMKDCMGTDCPGTMKKTEKKAGMMMDDGMMKGDGMMKDDEMMADHGKSASSTGTRMINDDDHGGSHMDGASMDGGMMDGGMMDGGSMDGAMGNSMN